MSHGKSEAREPVKVLSIQQPFADFVFHIEKWCENRSWRTNYRGPLYIHASRLDGEEVRAWREQGINLRENLDLTTGAIIGRVDLMDCVKSAELHRFAPKRFRKEWLFGKVDGRAKVPEHLQELQRLLKTVGDQTWQHVAWDHYAWIFTDAQLLAHPVPAKGKLNIWQHDWDPRLGSFVSAERAVEARQAAAAKV